MRPDDPWPARVDRIEVLSTEAGSFVAYRLEINPFGTLQEGEYARIWYGRGGFLGYSLRSVLEWTDQDGKPTGQISVFENNLSPVSVELSP